MEVQDAMTEDKRLGQSLRVRRSFAPRPGFTLIELLVVITAMSSILAATGVLMHFVLQIDRETRRHAYTVTTVGRLAEQFRSDVHQARGEPLLTSNPRTIELHLPGRQIVKWRIDESRRLIRMEQSHGIADTSAGGRPASREDSFDLPKGVAVTLELQSQQAARLPTIRIDSPDAGGLSLTIEALASRDQRPAEEGNP